MVDKARRRFLANVLTAAGLGTLSLGFGDFLLDQFTRPGLPEAAGSTTAATPSGQNNYLPDYAEFLQWLKGASGPFSGKTFNVSLEAEFYPLALQQRDPDFRTFSQVNSGYSIKPYSLQLQDVTLMVSTKSPSYDAFTVDDQNRGVFNPHLIPISQLMEQYPDLTYPNLNLSEFNKYTWDQVALYPSSDTLASGADVGSVSLLPLDAPLMVMFYRKDVFSTLELPVPTTWSEYLEDLKTIQSSGLVPYAVACEATSDISVVYEFLNHLASFGGKLWEIDGNGLTPVINSDAAIAALENFVSLNSFADPASYTYSWDNVFESLARGTAATALLWNDYIDWLNDPLRSEETGRFGLAVNPAGPSGAFSTFAGGGLGVSKYSANPGLAWLWVQWATARGTQETLLLDQYHVLPTRDAAFSSLPSGSVEGDAYSSPGLARGILQSGGVTSLVGFPEWYDVLDPLSFHLNQAWTGSETPTDALNAIQQKVTQIGRLTFGS